MTNIFIISFIFTILHGTHIICARIEIYVAWDALWLGTGLAFGTRNRDSHEFLIVIAFWWFRCVDGHLDRCEKPEAKFVVGFCTFHCKYAAQSNFLPIYWRIVVYFQSVRQSTNIKTNPRGERMANMYIFSKSKMLAPILYRKICKFGLELHSQLH